MRRAATVILALGLAAAPAGRIRPADCNGNGVDDAADIAAGTSRDCNWNGIPDECDVRAIWSFGGETIVVAGGNAVPIALADLDGDGRPDLVAGKNAAGSEEVLVFLDRGTGSYGRPAGYRAGNQVKSLVPADVGGTGRLDIIAGLQDGYEIYRANGDGTFRDSGQYVKVAASFAAFVVRDLDGDGRPDLAFQDGWYICVVPHGDEAGDRAGFPAVSQAFRCPDEGWLSLLAGDIDGDGRLDLVAGDWALVGPGWVYDIHALAGRPGGGFDAPRLLAAGAPSPVAAADLDRDGRLDFVAWSRSECRLVVAWSGEGGRLAESPLPLRPEPDRMDTPIGVENEIVLPADLDGDGRLELAAQGAGPEAIAILGPVATGGGREFALRGSVAAAQETSGLAAGDIDGDGRVDLLAGGTGGIISVFRGGADGRFPGPLSLPVGRGPASVAAADLDGDGLPDLAAADSGDDDVAVIRNRGRRAFAPAIRLPAGNGPCSLVAADLDLDGSIDLAAADRYSDDIAVFWSRGGAFTEVTLLAAGGFEPVSLVAADLDADGLPDLAAADRTSRCIAVLKGLGGRRFADPALTSLPAGPVSLAAFLTRGGSPRLAAALEARADNIWAPGLRGTIVAFTVPDPPSFLAAAALRGEGSDGLIIASRSTGSMYFLHQQTSYAVSGGRPGISSVLARDLDGSGRPDLAVACEDDGLVLVFADANSSSISVAPAGAGPAALAAADLDGDGRPELVAADFDAGEIAVIAQSLRATADRDGDGIPDECQETARFIRGDADADFQVTIADVLSVLRHLFTGVTMRCAAAGDADGDGSPGIGDAVYLLAYLFLDGAPPPAPFPDCGADPRPAVTCEFPPCR